MFSELRYFEIFFSYFEIYFRDNSEILCNVFEIFRCIFEEIKNVLFLPSLVLGILGRESNCAFVLTY